jgi:hypothetical protein
MQKGTWSLESQDHKVPYLVARIKTQPPHVKKKQKIKNHG